MISVETLTLFFMATLVVVFDIAAANVIYFLCNRYSKAGTLNINIQNQVIGGLKIASMER